MRRVVGKGGVRRKGRKIIRNRNKVSKVKKQGNTNIDSNPISNGVDSNGVIAMQGYYVTRQEEAEKDSYVVIGCVVFGILLLLTMAIYGLFYRG